MRESRIHIQESEAGAKQSAQKQFRRGISLHSHTLHSRESLNFINHAARRSGLLRFVLQHGEARYRAIHGYDLDLNRGWWTPPLAPADAFAVERKQIEALDLEAVVSLSDHDDIEAPMSLQAIAPGQDIPISVEWTVPFDATFFHIGVHNLPYRRARLIMARLLTFTANPLPAELTSILADLATSRGTLIVLNHPLWDESGIGADRHRSAALELLATRGQYIHALELNGLRPWPENQSVIQLARGWNKPAISGGDRHTLEPNAILNLTNATNFTEFAEEVRAGEWNDILVMRHYREAHASRIFHNMLEVFRTYEDHGHGWKRWEDRVFYRRPDDTIASLGSLWGDRPPAAVAIFAGIMQLAGRPSVRGRLRSLVGQVPVSVE